MPSLDNNVRKGFGCNGLVKKSAACSALETGISLRQAGAWYISTMPSLDNSVRKGFGCNGLVKNLAACSALETGISFIVPSCTLSLTKCSESISVLFFHETLDLLRYVMHFDYDSIEQAVLHH